MSSSKTQFIPKWARDSSKLADAPVLPDIGTEPAYAPRLPTRLLPRRTKNSVSSITLTDVVSITQRILNCVSYEVVYGAASDVIDLRSVNEKVLELAKIQVEPFEEGSFVIPGTLTEEDIDFEGAKYSGADVLKRFSEVMEAIQVGSRKVPASLTILQAVEELGRVTRREADIEYAPVFGSRQIARPRRVVVTSDFVSSATLLRQERVDPQNEYGVLEGRLTAIDLRLFTLTIQVSKDHVVKGSFGEFAKDSLISALNRRVRLSGTIAFSKKVARRVHAILAEVID